MRHGVLLEWTGPGGCGGARPTVALNTMLRNLDFILQAVAREGVHRKLVGRGEALEEGLIKSLSGNAKPEPLRE